MNIKFAKPFFSNLEHQAVKKVLSQDILVHGNEVKNFEKILLHKNKYSLATSSCTTALLMAYKYFNINENDEVIVPAQTRSNYSTYRIFWAKPIFVDSNSENGNINVNLIEKKITKKLREFQLFISWDTLLI